MATKWLTSEYIGQRDNSRDKRGWQEISSLFSEQHTIENVWIIYFQNFLIFSDYGWPHVTETLESEPMDKGDRGATVLLGHVAYEKTKIYSPLKDTSLCETGQIKWYIQIPEKAKFPWVNWNLFLQPCAMILYTCDIPQSRLCTKYIPQMYLFQEVEHVWHNYLYPRSRKNE